MTRRPLHLLAARAQHRVRRHVRPLVGALGAVAIAAGVVILFTTEHGARSAFLLALGVALLLIAWFGDRVEIEGFELLGAKARVRDVVKTRLELARSSEGDGSTDAAALQRQARVLQELVGLYGLYEHLRRVEPPGPERTADLDALARRMRSAGEQAEFDAAEVIGWFHDGTDPLRVIAINLMRANEDYRDFVAVLETVDAPHSLFEQYYGLLLAKAMLPDLDEFQRGLLRGAITRARRKRRLRRDDDLMQLSGDLLGRLG